MYFCCFNNVSFAVNASFWEQIKEPSDEPVQSIGSYANGCLAGAHALPVEGVGYQVIRPERARYYGHQASIDFIESFASQFQQQTNKQLLIGDMSLAQGGRFSFGHSSHQNGLDIDIWFRLEETRLSSDELADPQAISLIDEKQYQANESNWQDEHFQMVKLAASNPEVARIFVHPIIKQKLCNVESSTNREWLRKVRPWWGHHVHMHVRLDCLGVTIAAGLKLFLRLEMVVVKNSRVGSLRKVSRCLSQRVINRKQCRSCQSSV